ncbi:hypothetical protein [Streptomyces lonarensis]|uniref:hypothetical protein n=1 Tax=Streptomyces lonarensis TaxID=700599 RepID=UPI0030C660EF
MTHAPADPVTALLHRHRDLCERAVDPMEIAALLEARGVTDRTAARFRHRDVFSLAEELYARVPRVVDTAPVVGGTTPGAERGRRHRLSGLFADLLPAALGAVAVAVPLLADRIGPFPGGTGAVAALTALTTAGALLALGAVLRPRLPGGRCAVAALAASAGAVLLVGFGLGGAWLLAEVARGLAPPGVEAARSAAQAALVLAACVAPALWSADRFTAGACRRLAGSRTLRELTAATRPLLAAVVAGFAAVVGGLLAAAVLVRDCSPAGRACGPRPPRRRARRSWRSACCCRSCCSWPAAGVGPRRPPDSPARRRPSQRRSRCSPPRGCRGCGRSRIRSRRCWRSAARRSSPRRRPVPPGWCCWSSPGGR